MAAPDDDQVAAWAAVRTRLSIETSWLTAAAFRAVPVAMTDADASAQMGAAAVCDRWGRVYVDFSAEQRDGIESLAAAVRDACLNWVSGQVTDRPWHRGLYDEEFPAVTPAAALNAAHQAAVGLASHPNRASHYRTDELEAWREWATRTAGTARITWQQHLGGAARRVATARAGHQFRTFRRPSRRQSPGVVLPALRGPALDVAVIADISGSAAPDLPTMVAEVAGIVGSVSSAGGSITLYAVDDEVASTTRLPGTLPDLAPREGHFTDLRVGFAAAAAGHGADLVIVLTDAITAWPARRPAAACVVVAIGAGRHVDEAAAKVPDWAHVIRVET